MVLKDWNDITSERQILIHPLLSSILTLYLILFQFRHALIFQGNMMISFKININKQNITKFKNQIFFYTSCIF